jgi:hypothetical protein
MLHPPNPYARHRSPLPRFLVIAPPKTGSTWLADNLRCHPQLFVPAIKEVRFFSLLFKWLDLDWYASHFEQAEGRVAGEATPSYAAASEECIHWIRDLVPGMKLIFLMRDPVSRAWSHAKHMHRYREGCFDDCTTPLAKLGVERWLQHMAGEWPLVMGDYLGQLRRWLKVFPREQVFVGFFDSITGEPGTLLRRIFEFLGVDPNIDLLRFPIRERVLVGPEGEPSPALEQRLQNMFGSRTEELAGFLRTNFGLTVPTAWQRSLSGQSREPWPLGDLGDSELLRITGEEATFRTAYRELVLEYCGHDLVFYRGRLLAVPHLLGPRDLAALQEMPIDRLIADRTILTAPNVPSLRDLVQSRVKERIEEHFWTLEADIRRFREGTMKVHRALELVTAEVNRLAQGPAWMRTIKHVGRKLARPASFFG